MASSLAYPLWKRASLWGLAAAAMVLATPHGVHAQATDLIISEYVEGSSNNKYIELYNGTGAAVDLSDYQLRLHSNGAVAPNATATLTGTLAAGAVIVYRNSAATAYAGPATNLNSICIFNGDDAIALWKISTASYVDIFGNIGCDPGTAWTGTGISTVNRSLVRNSNICSGIVSDPTETPPANTNALCPFPTLTTEWTNFAQDDVSNLGSHTMTCGPTVNFAVATGSDVENAGTVTINLTLSPATTAAGTLTIAVANGPGAFYGAGADYTTTPAVTAGTITVNVPAGATAASFAINIVDDGATEADEDITFTLTGTTGGISLGSVLAHTFTIVDNDVVPTVNFTTLSISVLENAGAQNFELSITPAAPVAGSITLTVTDGPGVLYGAGNDYTTVPAVGGGTIVVPFAAGATTVSFTANVVNDVLPEDTESIQFSITTVPVGFVIGSNANSTLIIGDNDTPPTVLEPGDLVVVGVNANNFACGGASGEDLVSFFCFKPIVPGTELIITDNGYERCTAGLWGNTEGTVRLTRTGIAIPAGQVITLRISNTSGAGNVIGLAPDAGWSCTSLNGVTTLNLNAGGDQLFFAQGGAWTTNTAGAHNATFTGSIIYGFSTNPTFPWSAACGSNQRSNLPPGIECFSMAPTLATDFNKYSGPITSATQRDWIIRVEDVGNWSTYPNCADYDALGYNWSSAPVLPITAGAYVAGRWRGSTSTDWFDCKNWDDVRVPTVTTNVTVDAAFAARNCEVGLVPGSTAECASLLHTTDGLNRQVQVRNNSTLNIQGPLLLQRTTPGPLTLTLFDTSELNAASIVLQGVTPGNNEATLRCEQGGTIRVEGDLELGPGALFDLQGAVPNVLELGGNWTNLEDEVKFQDTNSEVRLVGNGLQTITTATGAEVFSTLVVNKTGGDVQLSSPVEVRTLLDLTNGRILSTATELLSLRNGSAVINASDASHVNGPVQKIGNTAFEFPVGKNNVLRPCSLSSVSGTTSGAFQAEYFAASPRTTFNNVLEPTLDHISDCEYWMIDRTAGTGNAVVHLTWREPFSCGVTDLPSLRVARWDGAMWLDRGNGGAVGDNLAGTIPTAAVQTLFSPWTLASINSQNPLPITLVNFDAVPVQRAVELTWTTATEQDNEHFTVERSADGLTFLPLLRVQGAGTSLTPLHYRTQDDAPLTGLSYYRLRQTDFDGTSTLSDVVPVRFHGSGLGPIAVHADDAQLTVFHAFPVGAYYTMLDMTGRLLATGAVDREGVMHLPIGGLPFGAYLLRMEDNGRVESVRFVR